MARPYISNVIPKLETLISRVFKSFKTPMSDQYHPEIDESPLLGEDGITKYRSIIGSLNWVITLGRFDVQYVTSTLSRYSHMPREGHLEAALRILGYLKSHHKGQLIFDTSYFNNNNNKIDIKEHNWEEFYPDAEEEIPKDMLPEKGEKGQNHSIC